MADTKFQTINFPTFKYPENVGQKPYDKWILFEAKSGRRIGRKPIIVEQNGVDSTLGAVALYLTESTLDSKLSVDWSDTGPMGTLMGTLAQKFANEGSNLFNTKLQDWDVNAAFRHISGGALDSLKAVARADKGMMDKALDFLKSAGFEHLQSADIPGLGNLKEVLPLATGMRVNPRTAALFDSVQFRDYDLDFRMIPRNRNEARQIDEIIHFFQFYMLPAYYGNTKDSGDVDPNMIGFPYEFDVTLYSGDDPAKTELGHVNKFERSVITGFNVDHSPDQKVMFIEDGKEFYPVATDITISMREIVLLDRNSDQIKRDGVTDLNDPRYTRWTHK